MTFFTFTFYVSAAILVFAGLRVITTRNPVTGKVDSPTLKILGRYRRDVASTEPLAFGIYGRVTQPGSVKLGDTVTLEG